MRTLSVIALSGAALVTTSAALTAPGCADDRDLASAPPATSTVSSASAGGNGGGGGAGGGGAGGEGAGGPIPEPPGPTKLTIVNGINDYEAVRFCFLPYPDGKGESVVPWPSGNGGLAFAQAKAVSPISSALPAGVDVRIYVIAGDLAQTAGKTCAELFEIAGAAGGAGGAGGGADAPGVIAASLAVLPLQALESMRSLLVVATGCLGGPGHTDTMETMACGPGYTPSAPTAGLLALGMSRIQTADRVNLQAVHGSAAMPAVNLRIKPATQKEWEIASELSLGAIGPKPPFDLLPASDYGSIENTEVLTYMPSSTVAANSFVMSSVFANSSLTASDWKDGASLVLVALGGYPGLPPGSWWHGFTFTLVKADP